MTVIPLDNHDNQSYRQLFIFQLQMCDASTNYYALKIRFSSFFFQSFRFLEKCAGYQLLKFEGQASFPSIARTAYPAVRLEIRNN